jgi:hypothetical protein
MAPESPAGPTTAPGSVRTVVSMRFDLDEHDLYPPDASDTEITKESKQHRFRVAAGATLLVWGTALLVQRTVGVDFDTFLLGLGVGAIAGWTQLRRYGWFVAGAIGVGLGASEVAGALFHGAFGSGIGSLLVAAGFAAIYVRYPRRSMWALIPAGIMALVGVAAFGVGLLGLIPKVFGRFLLPLLLVLGGGLLLFRHSLPARTVKIGLAAIVATFVLVGANSVPEVDHNPPSIVINGLPRSSSGMPLGLTPGQTLVMTGGGSGDITFARATADMPTGQLELNGPGRRMFSVVRHDGDRVIVGGDGGDARDYVVYVPAGIEIDIERGSGAVSGTLAGVAGDIKTGSGKVDLRLVDGGAEGTDDEGPLHIETGSGKVMLDSDLSLDLRALSDGDVIVNGTNTHGAYHSEPGTRGERVRNDTGSGDVVVDLPTSGSRSSSSTTTPAASTASTTPAAPTAPSTPAG